MGFRSRHQCALKIPCRHRLSTKPGRTHRRQRALPCPALLRTEVLGDRVRTALGAKTDDLESVELLALTPYADLPAAAGKRLRLRDGRPNALIRLVLRPLARTTSVQGTTSGRH